MYVVVRLLKGFPQPLTYKLSPSLQTTKHLIGRIIDVPLKTQTKAAVILAVLKSAPSVSYEIKETGSLHAVPNDEQYHSFLERLARIYFTKPLHFYQRLRSFVHNPPKRTVSYAEEQGKGEGVCEVTLTDEQQKVVDELEPCVGSGYAPVLLHGVTGSGKTEVYKRVIKSAFAQGKTVLFLCPEVSLARQFSALFAQQLPTVPTFGFHSSTPATQRHALWKSAIAGAPMLVVGVHLPILLPLSNLGAIIIDEEHETGFSEKKFPAVNSKHAALLRARMYQVPIILGSATPSIATLYHAREQGWKQFSLTRRFSGAFPAIQHVRLASKSKRKYFWFSPELIKAMRETLARGEQIIIYLNRRGFSFFAQCTSCGHTFTCKNCDVNMTVHIPDKRSGEQPILRCHYCDERSVLAEKCPSCSAPESDLLYKGIGTQQIVQQLKSMFPEAGVGRADTDVSRSKSKWKETIEAFERNEINILVGTQIITKGYHFPRVTLVGVIWADSSVHFPVYNAHESALQQLIQVAGRAGRVAEKSSVIVQSFDDHPLFSYINEVSYPDFCQSELEARSLMGYPPCGRLIHIDIKNTDPRVVDAEADAIGALLKAHAGNDVTVLGPARPVIAKIQRTHVRQIILKSPSFGPLYALCERIDIEKYSSSVLLRPE